MRKHDLFTLTLIFLFTTSALHAQTRVRGSVIDSSGNPLDGASVLLLRSSDSTLVKGSLTQQGSFSFEEINPGNYLISSSYAGMKDVLSKPIKVNGEGSVVIPPLKISESIPSLEAVTLTAKKPLFEQRVDRMIINVANSVTASGSTALEVLMRSPGINVNQRNNTITMNGKDGVVVILNGKINRMPIEAMVQMLAGMSAANIEKIELITTPPANFDAEGNAGFINIVLKQNTQYGTNGSVSATVGHGIGGGPVFGGSMNVNNRKEKVNIYGDYSFNRTVPNSYGTFYRKSVNGTKSIENITITDRDDYRRNHMGRIGVDYALSNKTMVGVLLSGFSNIYGMEAINTSNIFVNGRLDTTTIIHHPEEHPLENYGANLNLNHNFKTDEKLSVNADYIYYRDANTLSYLNDYYDGTANFIFNTRTRSSKITPIKFFVSTADYTKKISVKTDVEMGVKATISNFVNDVNVATEKQNTWIPDPDFTAWHNLDERILAAYTSFNIKLSEKTSSKMGLRYEYTNSNLGSKTQKNIVDRHYGNLFPTIYFSHTISENSSMNLSFNRRITRPTFNDMAPFVYFVDPNTIISGNPALQPSIASAVKWDYMLKRFILSLGYTYEKATIANYVPRNDPDNNKQVFVSENQKDKHLVNITVSLPVAVTNWWAMQNNLAGSWQELNGFYKGDNIRVIQQNFNMNSTQTFTLPRNFSIELTGSYQSGGLFGIYKMGAMTSLNMGVQKKLGEKSGTLAFNITDFSGVPHLKLSVDAPEHNLITNVDLRFNVTTFKLTYTRKFGNLKISGYRSRTTGSEEERQRVQ
jgi:hypothetical protein